jgi:hypothetical protein
MKIFKISIFSFVLFLASTSLFNAQKESGVFVSLGAGSHIANKKTAMMYSGGNNFTPFGIEATFSNPQIKPEFDAFFQYPYTIVELPEGMRYRPSVEIGAMVGYRTENGTVVYLESNFSNLKVEDVFVVEVENPNVGGVYPLEQFPVFGVERRLNLNFGLQLTVNEFNGAELYWPIFGNINSTRVDKNYFVVNNKQYQITHIVPGFPNQQPGGMGFGGGSGLGVRYPLNKSITLDFSYNLIYSRIRMTELFREWGAHHSVMLKVIWG